MDPLVGLVGAYLAVALLVWRGVRVYVALGVMVAVYGVLAGGLVEGLRGLASWNDLRVFVFIGLSLFLAGLLRGLGVLRVLVDSAGCRLSLVGVPAVIGLMPMPGGALVSAVALRERYLVEARVGRVWAVFLNYWWRHVWVPSWPLFQSIVITAAVFGLDPVGLVSYTWPGSLAAVAGGLLVSAPVLARVSCGARGSPGGFLAGLAPLAGLALLFAAGVPMLAALALVIAAVLAVWRPGLGVLREAAGLALSWRIHLVLAESLLFKNMLLATGAGGRLVEASQGLGVPVWLLAFSVPFLLGLVAGGENFFAATAMPVLYPVIAGGGVVDGGLLGLAYLGGFLGVMLSPVHLCLALTLEYFGAEPGPVMARVAAAVAASSFIGGVLVWLAS